MSTNQHSTALQITADQITERNEQRLLALKELTEVLQKNPASLVAYKLRGTIYLELGLKEEALSDLTQATKLGSEDDVAFNLLGMSQLALGKKLLAEESFSLAISLNPNNQQAYFNRGRARYAQGMATEAILDFKQAIILDTQDNKHKANQNSQNSGIRYQLGLIKNALGDLQEAEMSRKQKPILVK